MEAFPRNRDDNEHGKIKPSPSFPPLFLPWGAINRNKNRVNIWGHSFLVFLPSIPILCKKYKVQFLPRITEFVR